MSLRAKASLLPVLAWTPYSDWINVQTAYGAYGDGTHDDTAAIQSALTNATLGGTVYFPAGNYKITSTLNLTGSSSKYGVVLIGCGRSTTLSWYGASGGDFIKVNSNPYGRYEGLILDGRGIAGNGMHHYNTTLFETSIRYKHMGFYNLTSYGVFGDSTGGKATAEISFENCIFNTCGRAVFPSGFNEYDWTCAGCDFITCGYGVYGGHSNFYVRDCYFQGSTLADIYAGIPEHGCSVRRCKSTGSVQFLYYASNVSPISVQDCYVTGWTGSGGAIQLAGFDTASIAYCRFLNPPDALRPVRVSGNLPLFDCNNVGTTTSLYTNGTIYLVPGGTYAAKVGSTSGSAISTFVNSSVTVPTMVYDAKVDFSAWGDGSHDDTVAVQNTIDAARTHGSGAIAYLPKGKYKITSTLNVSGSGYVFGGSGYFTSLVWGGSAGGTLVSVQNPSGILMENMKVGHGDDGAMNNAIDIDQTYTAGTTKMTYDGIYTYGKYMNAPNTKGLRLNGLNSSNTVVLNMVEGNLRLIDSANATVIGNTTYEGAITVDQASSTRTGFLGIQTRLSTNNTYGITVSNSNNIVLSDWYQESSSNGISISGAVGNPAGRITIQGPNTDLPGGAKIIDANNYKGQVFYGTSQIYPGGVATISQTGTQPLVVVVFGNIFYSTSLAYSGTSMTLYTLGDWDFTGGPLDNGPECMMADLTPAYDDLQHLGSLDLTLNYPFVPV